MPRDPVNAVAPSITGLPALEGLRLLRYKQLKALGIVPDRKALRDKCRAGKFPQPVEIGKNSLAWRESDIRAYIDQLPVRPAFIKH